MPRTVSSTRTRHVNLYLTPALARALEEYAKTSELANWVSGRRKGRPSLGSAAVEILYEKLATDVLRKHVPEEAT